MAATQIPYKWIATPVSRQPTLPINAPVVTQSNGAVGFSLNSTSITRYGYGSPQITLETDCTADPGNLAAFLTTYRGTPLPRQPVIRLNLYARSETECGIILGVGFAQWVQITGAPSTWAPGAANFTVIGIHHIMGVEQRIVEWSTSALLGSSPTAPGPWFKWDTSSWDGTDQRPF